MPINFEIINSRTNISNSIENFAENRSLSLSTQSHAKRQVLSCPTIGRIAWAAACRPCEQVSQAQNKSALGANKQWIAQWRHSLISAERPLILRGRLNLWTSVVVSSRSGPNPTEIPWYAKTHDKLLHIFVMITGLRLKRLRFVIKLRTMNLLGLRGIHAYTLRFHFFFHFSNSHLSL